MPWDTLPEGFTRRVRAPEPPSPALPCPGGHKPRRGPAGDKAHPEQEGRPTYHTASLCPRCCKKKKQLLDGGAGLGERAVVSRVSEACLEPPSAF